MKFGNREIIKGDMIDDLKMKNVCMENDILDRVKR